MSTETLVLLPVVVLGLALVGSLSVVFSTVGPRMTTLAPRLPRFLREAGLILNPKIPFIDKVIGRINLRSRPLPEPRMESPRSGRPASGLAVMSGGYERENA